VQFVVPGGQLGEVEVPHGLGVREVGVILGLDNRDNFEYFEAVNLRGDAQFTSRVILLAATVTKPFNGRFVIHARHASNVDELVSVRWFAVAT
jgi:hypothetical protein